MVCYEYGLGAVVQRHYAAVEYATVNLRVSFVRMAGRFVAADAYRAWRSYLPAVY